MSTYLVLHATQLNRIVMMECKAMWGMFELVAIRMVLYRKANFVTKSRKNKRIVILNVLI